MYYEKRSPEDTPDTEIAQKKEFLRLAQCLNLSESLRQGPAEFLDRAGAVV
jgi:hypothetical protein